MPLGYFFIANWKKLALVLFLLVAIAPFVLLHVFVLCARIFEPKLPGATVSSIQIRNGTSLRVYRRDSPHANTTLVFVHGSPATASAFHKQFAVDFPGANLVAYDRPGFGGSLAGINALTLNAQAKASYAKSLRAPRRLAEQRRYQARDPQAKWALKWTPKELTQVGSSSDRVGLVSL